jgi:hypothetical protein
VAPVTDSYLAFTERGLTQLRSCGWLGFIIPDAWLSGIKYREFRRFVGLKNRIRCLVDLPYNVFKEAYVDCLLLVDSHEANNNSIVSVTVFGAKESVPSDGESWRSESYPYEDWVARIDDQLDLRFSGAKILERIEAVSIPLGQIAEIDRGLEAYGHKTSLTVRISRGYHMKIPGSEESWIRQFDGELRRYELNFGEPLYVLLGSHLAECPSLEFFTEDRILLRRLISRQFRLMACEVKNEKFANDSSTLNLIRFRGYARTCVLALLNSSLLSYRQLSRSSIARRDDYPKISLYEAKAFPIRRIEFTTPRPEREKQLDWLVSQYTVALERARITKHVVSRVLWCDAFSELLAEVSMPTGTLHIPIDVLHDFLAYLAEKMVELNKEKQIEIKHFSTWIENELEIKPDKNGKIGIESLTGKTILKGFLGDYQKDEEHVSFQSLWEVLRKNVGRLGRPLDAAFEQQMRQEYEKSLALLLPIKGKLAATDWLIDQLVFRLYGLTNEEIAIVEGETAKEYKTS